MKKLTEEQEQNITELSEQQREKFLEENKTVLFDIKRVTTRGTEIREQINKLNLANELVKMEVRQRFDADVEKVKKFLGEYADAVIVSEDERMGNFYYSIGVNDNNRVFVTYAYGKEDFIDWDNFEEIDGHKYQVYKQYDIETSADGYNNENHRDFETMFNDRDVVDMFEIAVQDYIAYHKPKETNFLDATN